VLANSSAITGAVAASNYPLTLGGDTLYAQYFKGIIDEVRIYNRALSPAEIQTDMNTPL
jgi:concanavalin A-like lectin/glucanase superfamily protein